MKAKTIPVKLVRIEIANKTKQLGLPTGFNFEIWVHLLGPGPIIPPLPSENTVDYIFHKLDIMRDDSEFVQLRTEMPQDKRGDSKGKKIPVGIV